MARMGRWGAALALLACALLSGVQRAFAVASGASGSVDNYTFETDVARMLEIIVHSLYSNKDVFLREVISNGSDALDKIAFLNVSNPGLLGDTPELEMRIRADRENRVLEIRDTGIGMTREHLVKHLGTIAKSGTSQFVDEFLKSQDSTLIGQFGVGFYSVFLVADSVEVVSKHNDDAQHIWTSDGQGSFAIIRDDDPETQLGRGTLLRLHIKDDADEYLEERKIRELVKTYSQYIHYPILLEVEKDVEKEVPVDEVDEDNDGITDSDADAPRTKTTTVKERSWERLNQTQALWTRMPQEVKEDEYFEFFKEVAKSGENPLAYEHFEASGSDVEFKALLFVPPRAPSNFYDEFYTRKPDVRLYVRRVFITDDFEDILPTYLRFVWGLVDSDTLPLNVSRETLQESQALKVIKRRLVKKVLDMIMDIHKKDEERIASGELQEGDEKAYDKFWKQWGKSLKLGLAEDTSNRHRIAKLLRVKTSKSNGKLVSLDEYIEGMKKGQKFIYFLSGDSDEEIRSSPLIERLLAKDIEVIFFTEPVDEILIQHLDEYEEFKFQNAAKEDMRMDDKEEKEEHKRLEKEYKDLSEWWREQIKSVDRLAQEVRVTTRLTTTPCIVVSAKFGWSAHMEKIMMAQALGDPERQQYMRSQKILEINPLHPMVSYIKGRFDQDREDADAKLLAQLMYDTALLESGYDVADPHAFSKSMYKMLNMAMQAGLDLDSVSAAPEDDVDTVDGDEAQDHDAEL